MTKERKIIQLTFKPASGRGTVTGHVVRYVKKRPGRGYVVAQYRVRLKNGSWSQPIRKCFPVVSGKILDIIGRKTVLRPEKKRRK
ncbi:hypothetical protein [Butyricicoccus pullicaecorum]|uniref:hypothetical protein n=1 Tax=Butyricicoccus pullicaecorum TaxID=501571 RepID=UPI003990AC6F